MAIRLGASSYSYQDEYALGLMTLEDTMAALSAAGGTGYEAILEQMLPGGNFMHLSDEFVEQWYDLLEKYGLEPTCADIFDDFNLFRNRTLTEREQLNQMEHYLRTVWDLPRRVSLPIRRWMCWKRRFPWRRTTM